MSFCALLAVSQLGCRDNPYDVVRITGTLTYEDGSLIPGEMITLMLVSQAEALDRTTHPRTGRGQVRVEDGSFIGISTYDYGDGVILGKHKVVLRALGPNESPSDAIPPEYTDATTTPLSIEVGQQRHFDLKIRKPTEDS